MSNIPLGIRMDHETRHRLKMLAVEQGMTMGNFLAAVGRHIGLMSPKARREALIDRSAPVGKIKAK